MLLLLSPAKRLDFTPGPEGLAVTRPAFIKDAAALAKIARTLSADDLRRLMGVSDALAELNVERFRDFRLRSPPPGVPAALAFAGDVYQGLKARDLTPDALTWAQDRLRILSGLYGLLRPLDGIQPYRLEMGIKLANAEGENLYGYWRRRVTRALRSMGKDAPDPTVVNLASQEYFGAVDSRMLKLPVVTCHFKEEAGSELKLISFFAKRARGAMARFAIDGRVDVAEGLKGFDRDGYRFRPEFSDAADWVFTRTAA